MREEGGKRGGGVSQSRQLVFKFPLLVPGQYCHYVAGLVGIGLSQLFSASGLEGEGVGRDQRLANSMGLFLQKTNIIRDYLEDTLQGREFWPREVCPSPCPSPCPYCVLSG